MALVLLLAFVLGGCVHGHAPTEPCPTVVVYWSIADTVLVADSIDYEPECP